MLMLSSARFKTSALVVLALFGIGSTQALAQCIVVTSNRAPMYDCNPRVCDDYAVIRRLYRGDRFDLIASGSRYWHLVNRRYGERGWVHRDDVWDDCRRGRRNRR